MLIRLGNPTTRTVPLPCTRQGQGQEAMPEKQVHAVALSEESSGEGVMVSGAGSK